MKIALSQMSPTECNYNRWIVRLIAPAEKKLGGNKRCLHLAMYCNTFYWHCINHIIVLKKNSKQYRMIMGKTISLSMSHKNFICSCHGIKFNHILDGSLIENQKKELNHIMLYLTTWRWACGIVNSLYDEFWRNWTNDAAFQFQYTRRNIRKLPTNFVHRNLFP